jgi:hypothetical protein
VERWREALLQHTSPVTIRVVTVEETMREELDTRVFNGVSRVLLAIMYKL